MIRKILALVVLALILAACGTVATPVGQQSVAETKVAEAATAAKETADAPTLPATETLIPPTATPIPPTATLAPPTATTEPATATAEPTEARAEAAATTTGQTASAAGPTGDAANGDKLFHTYQAEAGFACSTCHLTNSEDRLIGPGLLNVSIRAASRVPGQTAEQYIHTSIVDPSAYVVEGYPDNLMPKNWAKIYNESQINDIIAYLFTLKSEPDTSSTPEATTEATAAASATPADSGASPTADSAASNTTASSDSGPAGDPAKGQEIFTTFYPQANFACATCHLPNSEQQLIGPGLLNVSVRAASRVPGETAEEYVRNSILHPSDYVVEGFPDNLMPHVYPDVFSEEQLNNLIAYLFTLKG